MSINPDDYLRLALEKEANQEEIHEFVYRQGVNATRLNNACRGLADDCGELNGAVKKYLEYQQPLDRVNVIEEIGDCFWRLAQACKAIDVSISDVMEANLKKLHVRYKGEWTHEEAKDDSRNRNAEAMAIVESQNDRLRAAKKARAEDDGVYYDEGDSCE